VPLAAALRSAPCQNQGWQLLTDTALTSGPTMMVAGPATLLLSMMSLVFVDDRRA
jgi:hypothetical protein